MRRPYRILIVAAAFGLTALVGACGLFDTREPAQPPPPVEGCRALTGGPNAAVIPNIEDFYARSSAATCYNSVLDPSFHFHPDAIDSSQALPQTPFIGWDESVEKDVNLNIASVQNFINVDFQGEYAPAIISTDLTTEVRFYNYQLRVSITTPPDTLRYTGQADITFHRGTDGQWRIKDWVDRRGSVNDSTWGSLRSQFRF